MARSDTSDLSSAATGIIGGESNLGCRNTDTGKQVRACFEEDLGLTKLLEYFDELGGNCVEQRLVVLGICLSLE
jgi:hypothetical protein